MQSINFISYFPYPGFENNEAVSVAGNRVQNDIGDAIKQVFSDFKFQYIVMPTISASTNLKLYYKKNVYGDKLYPSFFNIKVVKMLWFAIVLLKHLIENRPQILFIWNSYFFQNIAVWMYVKFINRHCKVVMIIQDIHLGTVFGNVQQYIDRLSIKFIDYFSNIVLPVSEHIISDFKIKTKSILAIGGLNDDNLELDIQYSDLKKSPYVIGGAIEPHNGVLRLVKAWPIGHSYLNIYGSGSDVDNVLKVCSSNPFVNYCGKISRNEYLSIANQSKAVFVLRYSDGIDARYFFPSKFLEACLCNTQVICNNFENFPGDLKMYVKFLSHDLSNIVDVINKVDCVGYNSNMIKDRIRHVKNNYSWQSILSNVKENLTL